METRSTDKRMWTWVSPDGKSAAAGMSPRPGIGMKPGAHREEQPFKLDDGRYVALFAANAHAKNASDEGGISGGNVVRGAVTPPPKDKYPPPPPAPKEPHLVYSHKTGKLTDPEGGHMATGYAGQGKGRNNTGMEGDEGIGPLPRGNWRIREVDKATRDRNGWPDPAFKLEPDPETEARVRAMGRDPNSFYVHAKAIQPERQGNGDSKGCIALDKAGRVQLKSYEGEWIRVEK